MAPAMNPREMAAEEEANKLFQNARRLDDIDMFEPAARVVGVLSQTHERKAGDHFLSNVDIIDGTDPDESQDVAARRGGASTNINRAKSYLLQIAEKMPKGAHLHIHFNANLRPQVLLEKAERMPNMHIWTSAPLVTRESFDLCEVQFNLGERKEPDPAEVVGLDEKQIRDVSNRLEAEHDIAGPNIFDEKYEKNSRMRYAFFRQQWKAQKVRLLELEREGPLADDQRDILAILDRGCRNWLISKLVFHAEEAHNAKQTQDG